MDVQLKLEHDLLAVEQEHDVHAMVALTAPAAPPSGDRPPLRLALVVDRSGSMAGEPLRVVKRCAAFLVDRLQADDAVALVTYDDEADLVAPLQAPDPAALQPAIAAIGPGGMTNLSGGWLKAVEQLQHADDGVRRILLLTDGQANQGITDPAVLTRLARSQAQAGIATTTLGFGPSFDEDLLTAMADAGRGTAHYLASPEDAPAAFAAEFADLVSLAAQNVSVEIVPGPAVELVGVLGDQPCVGVPGGVQVSAGDAYDGQQLRVVFRLHIPDMAALGPAKVADVVVRYVTVGDEVAAHEVTYPLVVNLVSAEEAARAVPDAEVVEEVVVLTSARSVEEARRLADAGDYDAASALLGDATQALQAVLPASPRADELAASAAEIAAVEQDLGTGTYSAAHGKALHYTNRSIQRRRGGKRGGS